jgi:hypothetical protein
MTLNIIFSVIYLDNAHVVIVFTNFSDSSFTGIE